MKSRTLTNRKGCAGSCRNYVHAYTAAKLRQKKEHFMSHREMRVYWNDVHDPLYGPLNLMSRHISYVHRR